MRAFGYFFEDGPATFFCEDSGQVLTRLFVERVPVFPSQHESPQKQRAHHDSRVKQGADPGKFSELPPTVAEARSLQIGTCISGDVVVIRQARDARHRRCDIR